MSTEYDDKIVRMQFDNKQFESGVQTTIASLDELKASLKFDGVTTGIDNLASKVKNVSFDNMTQGIEQVVVKIPVMGTVLDQTIRNMTNSVTSFVKTTLDKFSTLGNMKSGFGEYELQIGAVKTIMASTGESVETVNKYLEELNKYADDTIYSFSDMTQNIGKFTNAGVKLPDAVAAIKGIANEAALAGANTQEASRAMYNFAQSLSGGAVKYKDWMSIENANMATVEFKQELIDTGLALGTLRREGNKYITTTTDMAGKVSDAFDAVDGFTSSLSNQWMTSDVLVKTLNRYTDTTTEIGRKATDAATKVNTLTQALGAIAEGIGSSWSQSWQYIIGDFEDATEMWTKFKDAVEGILGPSNDARNAMLKFWATGKDGAEEAIELTEEETKKYQALFDVAHQGVMGDWGNGADRMNRLTAAGYDYAEVQGVINKIVDGSVKSWEDLAAAQKKEQKAEESQMTGREMFIQGLKNLYTAIAKFGGAIKAAWRDIFPKKNGNALVAMSAAFMKLTEKLIISDKTADEIRRTFRGLFSVLGLVATVIKAVIKGIGALVMALVSGTKKSNASIWTITAVIGDLLTAFTAIVRESGILESVFVSAGKVIGTTGRSIINIIGSIVKALWNLIKAALGMKDVDFNLDLITNVFAVAAGSIAVFSDFIASKIEAFGFIPVTGIETFTANVKNAFGFFTQEGGPFAKAVDFFLAAWEKLKIGLMVVAAALAPVIGFIKAKLQDLLGGELTLENFLKFLKDGGAIILLAELAAMIHNLRKVLGDFVGVGKATITMFEAFGDTAKAMTKKLKIMTLKLLAAALLQIALAIAVMVGAMYLLSRMSSDDLKKGLGAFTALMAELIIVLRQVKSTAVAGASGVLLSLGIGVALLVWSLKTLAKMDMDKAYAGLFLLGILFKEMTSIIKRMQNVIGPNANGMQDVAKTLIGIAIAAILLMIPLKILGKMDSDQVWQGLGFMEILFAELASVIAAMQGASRLGKGNALQGVAKTMIALAFSMILLMIPLIVLSLMPMDRVKFSVEMLSIIMGVFAAAIFTMSKNKLSKGLVKVMLTWLAIIAVLTICVIVLTKVPIDKIFLAEVAIGLMVALIVVATEKLSDILKKKSVVDNMLKVLWTFVAMIAIFAIIFLKLSELSDDKLLKAGIGMVVLVAVIAVIILLIEEISEHLADPKNAKGADKFSETILSLGLSFIFLAGGIYLLIKAFKELNKMELSPDLFDNLAMFGAFLVTMVSSVIGGIIGSIIAAVPAIVNGIVVALTTVLEALDNNLDELIYHIKSIITKIANLIFSLLPSIIKGLCLALLEFGPTLIDTIMQLIVSILEALDNNMGDILEHVGSIIIKIVDKIVELAPDIADSLLTTLVSIFETFAGRADEIAQMAGDMVTMICAVINGIADKVGDIIDAIENLIGSIVDELTWRIPIWGKKIWELAKKLFNWVWKKLKEWIIEPVAALGKRIIGGIVKFIINGINSAMDFVANLIEDAINAIIHGINKIPGVDVDDMSISAPNLPTPEWVEEWSAAAKGAVVNGAASGGSNTIVGEAGPELLTSHHGKSIITPLSNQHAKRSTKEALATYTEDIAIQLKNIDKSMRDIISNISDPFDDTEIRKEIVANRKEMFEMHRDILNVRVMLDTGALVGQLAGPMDKQFGSMNKLRVRASGSIKK